MAAAITSPLGSPLSIVSTPKRTRRTEGQIAPINRIGFKRIKYTRNLSYRDADWGRQMASGHQGHMAAAITSPLGSPLSIVSTPKRTRRTEGQIAPINRIGFKRIKYTRNLSYRDADWGRQMASGHQGHVSALPTRCMRVRDRLQDEVCK
ncbi:hypothetical protein NDU88_002527 [Pleurodeles waltl]|uniref:Uncharacterized protein n=1 Tax=Pleurodeles waltl TaxID=8319 RepID=A0AAV7TM82_PLEWA|nr:hypothetical protein NDU88_002527 [Pleurodeles waltl]